MVAKSRKLPASAESAALSGESCVYVVVTEAGRSCTLETAANGSPILRWSPDEADTVFPTREAAEAAIVPRRARGGAPWLTGRAPRSRKSDGGLPC
jgi:hypothetical protein